jgi:hypothetical protein
MSRPILGRADNAPFDILTGKPTMNEDSYNMYTKAILTSGSAASNDNLTFRGQAQKPQSGAVRGYGRMIDHDVRNLMQSSKPNERMDFAMGGVNMLKDGSDVLKGGVFSRRSAGMLHGGDFQSTDISGESDKLGHFSKRPDSLMTPKIGFL